MSEDRINKLKSNIIAIGHLMWEKDLASGLNGNISARIDEQHILITARGTCLGFLQEEDILTMNLDGTTLDEGEVSSEKPLHTEIYKNFPETGAVIHTHTTVTNAYFLSHDCLEPQIFETRFFLGKVTAIPQMTPSVTDVQPVIDSLKKSNLAVLKNHGVVAMGEEHFDGFLLIQALEDAVKVNAYNRIFCGSSSADVSLAQSQESQSEEPSQKGFKLFSQEQIDAIVERVNKDSKMLALGEETNMTMDLAVKLDETGQVYSFHFNKGHIDSVGNDEEAEFLVSAPEEVWRAVFNREIDPFVATTQRKMILTGDFGKLSQWYSPCSRVFEIWQEVPVV